MQNLKKISAIAMLMLCFALPLYSQNINGTQQMPNRGFELWDNEGSKSIEPKGWNSFMTANASGLAAQGKDQRLTKENGGRPNSKGGHYLRIYSNAIIGIVANGNITTGRINMGSTSATDASNHNYTMTDNADFHKRITTVPDSLVLWVKFIPSNTSAGHQAQINAIIHNGQYNKDPGTNMSTTVATALYNPIYKGAWERVSVPFKKTGNTNDAQFFLMSITTNRTPGGGSAADQVLVDDLFFVYNPEISVGEVAESYGISTTNASSIQIPFTIEGTMSPENNLPDNVIIAELSDKNGSFNTTTEIGRLTTNESGSLTAQIATNTENGTNYRIRIRSTNYPLTSNDNGKNIEIYTGFYVDAKPFDNRGAVIGGGIYKLNADIRVAATANSGNHFVCWKENGNIIEGAEQDYSFVLNKDRTLVAHFDTNYYNLSLNIEEEGDLNVESGRYIHASTLDITATPKDNYSFVGFYENDNLLSRSSTIPVQMLRDRSITAKFEAVKYNITLNNNNASLGSISGGGSFAYNSHTSLNATPAPFCNFVAWLDGIDTLSKESTYEHLVTKPLRITALFTETFYNVTTEKNINNAGEVSGGGKFKAQAPNTRCEISATPSSGYEFLYWEKYTNQSETPKIIEENPYIAVNGRITEDMRFVAVFAMLGFDVTLSMNIDSAGVVSGGGRYIYNGMATINAEANKAYNFICWINSDNTSDTISKNTEFEFEVTEDKNITAVFEIKSYDITGIANDNSMGSVNGSGKYKHYSTVILEATANDGYEFRYWLFNNGSDDVPIYDTLAIGNTIYSFEVSGYKDIIAEFSMKRKTVTSNAKPIIGGVISGCGTFEHGTNISISQVPNQGYTFSHWEDIGGNIVSNFSVIQFDIIKDTCFVAVFNPIMYDVTIRTNGDNENGSVSFDSITFVTSYTAKYRYNDTIDITAKAVALGYKFTDWRIFTNGKDSSMSSIADVKYVVKGETRLTAYFSNTTSELSANAAPAEGGSIVNTGNKENGNWYTIIANTNKGYTFLKWENSNGDSIANKPNLDVLVTKDTNFTAIFTKSIHTLSLKAEPSVAGQVDGDTTAIFGSPLNISCTTNEHYKFIGWFNNDTLVSDTATFSFILEENTNYTAKFDSNTYNIQLVANNSDMAELKGSGVYKYMQKAKLEAIANVGSTLIGYIVNKKDTIRTKSIEIIATQDSIITALLDTTTYNFSLLNSDINRGSIIIRSKKSIDTSYKTLFSNIYNHGDSITLEAKNKENYTFKAWLNTNSEEVISDDATLLINIVKDTNITSVFEAVNKNLELNVANNIGGDAFSTAGNTVKYGTNVKIEASANFGYEFMKWTINNSGNTFSEYAIVNFIISRDTSLIAHFKKKDFLVNVEPNDLLFGSVSGAGIAKYDSLVKVSAKANYGYRFNYWEEDGVELSSDSILGFNISQDRDLIAVFEAEEYIVEVVLSPESCGYTLGEGIYKYNSVVSLEAVANENYFIKEWRNTNRWVSDDSVFNFTIKSDTTFYLEFQTDTLEIVTLAENGGSVEGGGRFVALQEVNLEAFANEGYKFSAWVNDTGNIISNENPHVFNANINATYIANFTPIMYEIKVNKGFAENCNIIGEGTYLFNNDVALIAVADSNHNFTRWELGENSVNDSIISGLFTEDDFLNPRLVYNVKKDLDLKAVFAPKKYVISAIASPIEGGSILNAGTYEVGANVELVATAAPHFAFAFWSLNGEKISDSNSVNVNVSKNENYVAVFNKLYYNVVVTAYPTDVGVLNGAGRYLYGDTVTISIAMNPGYIFKNWVDKDFNVVSNEMTFTTIVNGNLFFTATSKKNVSNEHLSINNNLVNVSPNPSRGEFKFIAKENIEEIYIYNSLGINIISYKNINTTNYSINIENVNTGVYFYIIRLSSEKFIRGKVIKL